MKADTLIGGNFELLYSSFSNKLISLDRKTASLLEDGKFEGIDHGILTTLKKFNFVVSRCTNEVLEVIEANKRAIKESDFLYHSIQPSANCRLGCCRKGWDRSGKRGFHLRRFRQRIEEDFDRD